MLFRSSCTADEYSSFVAVRDDKGEVHLNGRLTLGENTADNGGLKLAYMALMNIISNTPVKPIDGYTPEQRFFLAYGQIWCQNTTPQQSRVLAITDPHSPGRWRVNGAVQNSAAFQKAWGCKDGQPMVRENACRVWESVVRRWSNRPASLLELIQNSSRRVRLKQWIFAGEDAER